MAFVNQTLTQTRTATGEPARECHSLPSPAGASQTERTKGMAKTEQDHESGILVCSKCKTRIAVAVDGWECPKCKPAPDAVEKAGLAAKLAEAKQARFDEGNEFNCGRSWCESCEFAPVCDRDPVVA